MMSVSRSSAGSVGTATRAGADFDVARAFGPATTYSAEIR